MVEPDGSQIEFTRRRARAKKSLGVVFRHLNGRTPYYTPGRRFRTSGRPRPLGGPSIRELSQELFEGHFSRAACGLDGLIKDRRACYRALSTSPIDLPSPLFRRRRAALNNDRKVGLIEEFGHGSQYGPTGHQNASGVGQTGRGPCRSRARPVWCALNSGDG